MTFRVHRQTPRLPEVREGCREPAAVVWAGPMAVLVGKGRNPLGGNREKTGG